VGIEVLLVRADLHVDRLAVLEQDHRRDALDAVLRRKLLLLVDVDLRHDRLAVILLGDLLDQRGDHPARAAPRRKKVDEHNFILLNQRFQRFRRRVYKCHIVFLPVLIYSYGTISAERIVTSVSGISLSSVSTCIISRTTS